MKPEFIQDIRKHLIDQYECHTIILYGSYANGDYTAESDVDLIGFTERPLQANDTSFLSDIQLDAWIYNTEEMANIGRFLHIRDGHLLFDRMNRGHDFLADINRLFDKGPKLLSQEEKDFQKAWLLKMLRRTSKQDTEGNFRYHWMLTDSLEIYCKLKDQWYWGPKKTLRWLEQHDRDTYLLFEKGLHPKASFPDVEELINHLVNPS